jgi:hypothetical protein
MSSLPATGVVDAVVFTAASYERSRKGGLTGAQFRCDYFNNRAGFTELTSRSGAERYVASGPADWARRSGHQALNHLLEPRAQA